jgi:murein DD-endopeptidase MepM/ murein hydrolase activator NlpD
MQTFELFYPVRIPQEAYISQGFGDSPDFYKEKLGINGHNGIDFACPVGTPVLAAHDGVVTYSGFDKNGGNMIEVCTIEDHILQGVVCRPYTVYCHFNGPAEKKLGDNVSCGDVLGFSGNTGLSTGPHLHFGLKGNLNGVDPFQENGFKGAIDPSPYFNGIYAGDWKRIYFPAFTAIIEKANRIIALLKGRLQNTS